MLSQCLTFRLLICFLTQRALRGKSCDPALESRAKVGSFHPTSTIPSFGSSLSLNPGKHLSCPFGPGRSMRSVPAAWCQRCASWSRPRSRCALRPWLVGKSPGGHGPVVLVVSVPSTLRSVAVRREAPCEALSVPSFISFSQPPWEVR